MIAITPGHPSHLIGCYAVSGQEHRRVGRCRLFAWNVWRRNGRYSL